MGALAPLTLIELQKVEASTLKPDDVRATIKNGVLNVTTGTQKQWPGLAIPAPGGNWDLSRYAFVEVDVRNVGTEPVTIACRVDNRNADGTDHCVTGNAKVDPGQVQKIRVDLKRATSSRMDGKLHGMRGYPVAAGGRGTVDPSQVSQILIFVSKPGGERQFEVTVGSPGTELEFAL